MWSGLGPRRSSSSSSAGDTCPPPSTTASSTTWSPTSPLQFLDRVARSPRTRGLPLPEGDEAWESVTWAQAGDQVTRLAAGLLALGIEPEQRVGIASGTRYEWILADLAVMCAGGATTTVYPSTNAEDTAYILSDSECRVVFAEDDEQIAKLTDSRAELPTVGQGRHLRRHRPTATG